MTLPSEIQLPPSGESYQQQVDVLIGPTTFTLIEAKRIRQGSFEEEQLAREFVAVRRDVQHKIPCCC